MDDRFSAAAESQFSLFFSFPKFGVVEHHLFFHGTNENVFDFKALGMLFLFVEVIGIIKAE